MDTKDEVSNALEELDQRSFSDRDNVQVVNKGKILLKKVSKKDFSFIVSFNRNRVMAAT